MQNEQKKFFLPWVKNLEIFRVSEVPRGGAILSGRFGTWFWKCGLKAIRKGFYKLRGHTMSEKGCLLGGWDLENFQSQGGGLYQKCSELHETSKKCKTSKKNFFYLR